MDEDDQDQKQFFKDLGATAEQTVQEVRGFEENYYSLIQAMMPALPWLADFNKKLQSYVEQNFAAAYEFRRELSQAKDMQDFVRIHTAYIQSVWSLPRHRWRISQKRTLMWHQVRLKRHLSTQNREVGGPCPAFVEDIGGT